VGQQLACPAPGAARPATRYDGTVNSPFVVATTSSATRPVGVVAATRTSVTRPTFAAAAPSAAGSVCASTAFSAAPSHCSVQRKFGDPLQ